MANFLQLKYVFEFCVKPPHSSNELLVCLLTLFFHLFVFERAEALLNFSLQDWHGIGTSHADFVPDLGTRAILYDGKSAHHEILLLLVLLFEDSCVYALRQPIFEREQLLSQPLPLGVLFVSDGIHSRF